MSTLKIKIFNGNDISEIESAVNEFIIDKFVISIQQCTFIDKRTTLIITVLYDDTFNCGYVKSKLDKEILNKINSV
ncbi:hypothetical protein [Desnuesiella massiliensis]|uniref:hypothetical protein n=1 Tax=Desnuesiella massiliensis TaxID=1650662 RepID=UPI0006E44B65|nr:hypothetical protein [Desnuesiella massiliensis]